jgi:tRNA modification GTPase
MPDLSRGCVVRATEVVELTPVGRGAVAVVLVAGAEALAIVEQCFATARGCRLSDVPSQQIVFGRFGGPAGEEVVVCRRSSDQIEIHCHGGIAAVAAMIARLVDRGCRQLSWQEWLRRTCDDPIRAAAQIALAEAPTARTAAILLDQYHGAVAAAVREISLAIQSENWQQATNVIEAVLAYRDLGVHLTAPWRVVLTGRTNVGKSSLINLLAGYQRSIVSHQPGTTRDVVTTTTAIDGWPVELADTAGLRDPQDELESAGIELATTTLAHADVAIFVHDATQPIHDSTEELVSKILAEESLRPRVIHVFNKIDLLAETPSRLTAGNNQEKHRPSQWHTESVVSTSAVTGEGVAELIAAVGRALVPLPPAPYSAVPFTAEQTAALEGARAAAAAKDSAVSLAALQPLLARDSVAGECSLSSF